MLWLEAAVFRGVDDWGAFVNNGSASVTRELGRAIGIQIDEALAGFAAEDVGMSMVVTTMLDIPFTSGWITWEQLAQATKPWTRCAPQSMVSAYECASWGFVLRYAKSCRLRTPLVVITIVDVNIFNLSHWHANANWGNSGFGITTLVFRCAAEDVVRCHVAKGSNGFGEFCIDLRNYMLADKTILVTPPFFRPTFQCYITVCFHRRACFQTA